MNQQHDNPNPASDAAQQAASDDDPIPQPGSDPLQSGVELHISREAPDSDPPTDNWLQPLIVKALTAADVNTGLLGINIVADDRMAELHLQFMNIPGPTDVLTFDMCEDETDPFEGDIIINIDEAARHAQQHNHDTRTEVLLYAVHGILHLLGYDDHTLEDFQDMHKREDQILQAIGIGKVFHLSPHDRPKSDPSNHELDT
ncbi:rRNA maturation RNase YbeY [Poriferisphaera corsica]|uniref:rRNA maturation RNase YbeY n=1 Tax=Poriferisphaera corsica TaxID=2528020 RepID=UPI0011A3C1DB|nr:rRNA maturation RNase YbeY [Poriferisphaera corsica]